MKFMTRPFAVAVPFAIAPHRAIAMLRLAGEVVEAG
jgi:hypothetical protein